MIEIATKSGSLDLQNDAKITIKQKSSLFTILEKEDKQSHSYPFTLPISSNNNRIIPSLLEQEKEETLQAVVRKNGVRLFKADLRVTENTNEKKEVALQLNQKGVLFNRKLNSLYTQLGTFFITDSTRYVDLLFKISGFILSPSSFSATVEVVVTGITYSVTDTLDVIMTTLAATINADTANNNANAIVSATVELRIEEVNPLLPFFAYSQNWNTRFGSTVAYGACGLIPLPKNVVTNRQAAETHANTIDNLADFRDSAYCFPTFLVNMNTTGVLDFVATNIYDVTGSQYKYYQDAVFLPNIRITALIEKVLSLEGWKLESIFLKDIEIEKLFLLNPYAIAHVNTGNWDVEQYLQFFWSDCLPDITLAELIDELKRKFCLIVDWNHTTKRLKIEPANFTISKKLAKEYECTPFFSEKVQDKNTGYTFEYNTNETDTQLELNSSLLASKIIGNGKEPITSDFPFLPTYLIQQIGVAFPFLQAGLKMPSSFAAFGYVRGFELFLSKKFWIKEGIVKAIHFMSYTDNRICKIDTENYSLVWEQLYEQFYKNYLNLLDKPEVEREIIFTFSDLQGIDLTQLIRLEYSNYFIKEVEYTLTNNEQIRILAKVTLIKTL